MTDTTPKFASYRLFLQSEIVDVPSALGRGWVYRGQSDAEWNITSSLERRAEKHNNREPWEFEEITLDCIRTIPPVDSQDDLRERDDFSWLALLQHHGCWTRMVDFTESFYVAIYFAIKDLPGHDAAVWAINTAPLDSRLAELNKDRATVESNKNIAHRLVNNAISLPSRYDENQNLVVVYGKPARLNTRLIAQQGLFLCPLSLKRSFMENLSMGTDVSFDEPAEEVDGAIDLGNRARDLSVVKFIIDKGDHTNLLQHLKKMNITESTLFPGLDGFARSLNYFATGME